MQLKLTVTLALLATTIAAPVLAEKQRQPVGSAEVGTAKSSEPAPLTKWIEPKTGMEFVWIPSGCFQMGSSDGDKNEQPVHKVCVKGFWMGKYEVTQAQYEKVMRKNPSQFREAGNPVENVSWQDAKGFTEEMSYLTGTKVNLPTEAQWEYACRGGGWHETYCGTGIKPDRMAWYDGNSGKKTHTAGRLTPNVWGLYDMSGNVWEWVADAYHESYNGAPTDGSAWMQDGEENWRVMRGGSWGVGVQSVRAANRSSRVPTEQGSHYGFRLARTLP